MKIINLSLALLQKKLKRMGIAFIELYLTTNGIIKKIGANKACKLGGNTTNESVDKMVKEYSKHSLSL